MWPAKQKDNVLRESIFRPGSVDLQPFPGPRRKGRPRDSWAAKLHSVAIHIAGNHDALESLLASTPAAKAAWRRAVANHCRS